METGSGQRKSAAHRYKEDGGGRKYLMKEIILVLVHGTLANYLSFSWGLDHTGKLCIGTF